MSKQKISIFAMVIMISMSLAFIFGEGPAASEIVVENHVSTSLHD